MSILANLFTLASLFSAFMSIIFSFGERFIPAAWALIISMVLDGIDGQVARKNLFLGPFGSELDSLVDGVAFGVAPSVLGYAFLYPRFSFWAIIALFLYLSCSIIRLARYNLMPKEKQAWYFHGLPTTASGGLVAGFVLVHAQFALFSSGGVFLFLVLALAALMVSRVRYLNLDGLKRVMKKGFWLVMLAALVLAFFSPELAVFGVLVLYIALGPFLAIRLT